MFRHALVLLFCIFVSSISAGDILETDGFSTCQDVATIHVEALDIQFDRTTNIVTFDVAASSAEEQNVTASLIVSAYGKQVYTKTFNPCDSDTYIQQLCPGQSPWLPLPLVRTDTLSTVPAGNFSAVGSQTVPTQYAALIPSIAYTVPDLDGMAKLVLTSLTENSSLACIQSQVTNSKTVSVPSVSYVAVGVAGAALLVSGVSAIASLGSLAHGVTSGSAAATSPTFMETIGWFQSMAMNGMLSVQYPTIYRSFTQNFGFSTGLISWQGLQTSIDSFRAKTGGNLTDDSVQYLQSTRLVWQTSPSNKKRHAVSSALQRASAPVRDFVTSVNGTTSTVGGDGNTTGTAADSTTMSKPQHLVQGIEGYANQLSIPQSNTFMTVLVIFAIAIAAITAGILLLKVVLEVWALFASFPKRLTSFRKRYWWLLAKTITNLILLLYGVWVLYCVYQFKIGDSWAAKLLAGITLGAFTALLVGFSVVIFRKAHASRQASGSVDSLFSDKEVWQRYSLFYESYKMPCFWLFVPSIVYLFAKSCVIAGASGHGLAQTAGQLVIETVFFALLLVLRPYARRSGNIVNIVIQAVRVVSVVCILTFVEVLGVSQTTKTVTGLVLVIMQSVLTAVLAILIAVNAISGLVRMNPHRRRRKEAERLAAERKLELCEGEGEWDSRDVGLPPLPLPRDEKAKTAAVIGMRPISESNARGRMYRSAGFAIPYSPVAPSEAEHEHEHEQVGGGLSRPPRLPAARYDEARMRDGSRDRLVGAEMGRRRGSMDSGSVRDLARVDTLGTEYGGRGGYWARGT